MLIIVITCIIVHDVLVFYGLRSSRKLIKLFYIATRRPLREVYHLSLSPTNRGDLENSSFKECKWVDIHVGSRLYVKTLLCLIYIIDNEFCSKLY